MLHRRIRITPQKDDEGFGVMLDDFAEGGAADRSD